MSAHTSHRDRYDDQAGHDAGLTLLMFVIALFVAAPLLTLWLS